MSGQILDSCRLRRTFSAGPRNDNNIALAVEEEPCFAVYEEGGDGSRLGGRDDGRRGWGEGERMGLAGGVEAFGGVA